MHVGVAFVADGEAAVAGEPGEGAFDDPALGAESGAVLGLAAGDQTLDSASSEQLSAAGVVVAAVRQEAVGAPAGAAGYAGDVWDAVN